MPEPESVREICRRLVADWNAKRDQRAFIRLIDTVAKNPTEAEVRNLSPALSFDLFLTDQDREFLASMQVQA